MATFTPFGATGKFPRGKLNTDDEGELRMGVTVNQGTVILAFGKPIKWLGLTPQIARDLAANLIERADEAAEYAFNSLERNARIEQTAKAFQQAVEDECQAIRAELASERPF